MTRTCHHDDTRTATQHLREDSSRCRRVGAVVLPNHPQLVVPCEAVLEEAARKRTLRPPHWRRAARSGLSLQREPISQSRSRRRLFLRCVGTACAVAERWSGRHVRCWQLVPPACPCAHCICMDACLACVHVDAGGSSACRELPAMWLRSTPATRPPAACMHVRSMACPVFVPYCVSLLSHVRVGVVGCGLATPASYEALGVCSIYLSRVYPSLTLAGVT